MKKTLVIGASTNPARVSYSAIKRFQQLSIEVIAIGNKEGEIDDVPIITGKPELKDINTITVYLNPIRQEEYAEYMLRLKPARIIFNPGAENFILMKKAKDEGIKVEMACTLVMLATGQY